MQKFSVFDSAKYLFDEANSFVCFFLQYNIQNRCRNIVLRVYIYHSHILLLCYSMLVWLVVLSCLTSLVHSHIKNPQWYKKLQESQKRKKKKTFFTNTKSENVHWVIWGYDTSGNESLLNIMGMDKQKKKKTTKCTTLAWQSV